MERRKKKQTETAPFHINTTRVDDHIIDTLIALHRDRWTAASPYFSSCWDRNSPVSGVAVGHFFQTRMTEATDARDSDCLLGMIGFRSKVSEEDRKYLAAHADLAVKALFVLAHHYHSETRNMRGAFAAIHLPLLMDDLGYKRLGQGQHSTRNRNTVLRTLRILTKVEVTVIYDVGGRKSYPYGPVVQIAPIGKDKEVIGWDADHIPAIQVLPGLWRYEDEWQRYNQFTGAVDRRYSGLEPGDTGRSALFLGGKLAMEAHMNRLVKHKKHLLTTLEEWAGLDGLYPDDKGKRREKLGHTLDELVTRGILSSWEPCGKTSIYVHFLRPEAPKTYTQRRMGKTARA